MLNHLNNMIANLVEYNLISDEKLELINTDLVNNPNMVNYWVEALTSEYNAVNN